MSQYLALSKLQKCSTRVVFKNVYRHNQNGDDVGTSVHVFILMYVPLCQM